MNFELHPNLAAKTFIIDLPLCRLLLEDNRHYPWLFLVPRRANIQRIMDLSAPDQLLLLSELDLAQHILWNQFQPTQLNVAAIGNKTPQLHIHLIARYANDPAWPGCVWDHSVREKYPEDEKNALVAELRRQFAVIEKEHPFYSLRRDPKSMTFAK